MTDAEGRILRKVIEANYAEHLPEIELGVSSVLPKGSMYSLTWEVVD